MGWKGTVRSINASLKAMEREAQKRQRMLEKERAAAAKLEEKALARLEVDEHDNLINLLTSVHCEHSEQIDWEGIAETAEPTRPPTYRSNQEKIKRKIKEFKPSFLTKALGREAKALEKLEKELESALARDHNKTARELREYKKSYDDWKETTELAQRIVGKEPKSLISAIERLNPFSDISELGSSVEFVVSEAGKLHCTIHVNGEDVVPAESKSLLKSGKVSVKKMPKGKYFEIYQDYVCGCVLRVGTELLALLPINSVLVNAVTPMLDTSTGHIEEQPILSIYIPRQSVQKLNLEFVDPSDAMSNFSHRMDFKKTKGFSPINPLTHDDFKETVE